MYKKTEPVKVEPDLVSTIQKQLVDIVADENAELAKAKALAVAVADRYAGCGQIVANNPTAVKIFLEYSQPPEYKVLLKYPHPHGRGDQKYFYMVNPSTLEGRFVEETDSIYL